MTVLLSVISILLSFIVGYFLLYYLEEKEVYNVFTAILMPSIVLFALWLVFFLIFPILGYILMFLFPFLLIVAAIGGVFAHRKRKKQHQTFDIKH